MSNISHYTVSNKKINDEVTNVLGQEKIDSVTEYVAGTSVFKIPLSFIEGTYESIGSISIENTSIVEKATVDTVNNCIELIPSTAVKTSGKTYKTNISYNVQFNESKTVKYFSSIAFEVEINGSDASCVLTAHNNRLGADDYLTAHGNTSDDKGKDNLDSLVTKKALIANLKEFGRQVSTKVGATTAFSINYDLDGGHWDNGFTPRFTFVNSTGYTPKVPKRVGYTFSEWKVYSASENDTITGILLYHGDSAIEVGTTQNITAKAIWTPIVYQVKFKNVDGNNHYTPYIKYGEGASTEAFKTKAYEDDKMTPLTNNYISPNTSTGYTFKDMYTTTDKNGQEIVYKNGTSLDIIYDLVKSDNEKDNPVIELTPVTTPKVFNITYTLNPTGGEDIKSDAVSLDTAGTTNEYTYGTTFNLPIPVAKGYSFDGWTISEANLTGQRVINPSDLANVSGNNITLIATWTKNTYHFEFDAQGGTLNSNDLVYISPDAEYTINDPSKEGYTFSGWTGDNSKVTIDSHDTTAKTTKITVKDNIDTDIILKANWDARQVPVTIEYYQEDVDTTRKPDTTASLSNTHYALASTEPLQISNNTPITDTSITKGSDNKTLQFYVGENTTQTVTITPPTGFDINDVQLSNGGIVNADGTSVVKVYLSRRTAYYKVNRKYDAGHTATEALVDHVDSTVSTCLYGQVITVNATYDDNIPARGYTANTASVTQQVEALDNTNPNIFTIIYNRKQFNVKYDLNDCATMTGVTGNLKTVTALYNQLLTLPLVDNNTGVQSSTWSINGSEAKDVIENEDKSLTLASSGATNTSEGIQVKGETVITRVPTYRSYPLHILSNKYPFTYNNGTYNTAEGYSSEYSNNNLNITDFPYYLENATCDGYTFDCWEVKLGSDGNYTPLNGYILSESLARKLEDINSNNNTGADYNIYVRAKFAILEPKIDAIGKSITTSGSDNKSITLTGVSTNADILYLSVYKANNGIGNVITQQDNPNTSWTGQLNGDIANDTILMVTPVYTGPNKNLFTTGKPWFGKVTKADSNYEVDWKSIYAISSTDTDTIFNGEIITGEERRKLALISEEATNVAVAQGQITDTDEPTPTASDNVNASTEKYAVGTVKVNGVLTNLYGKDTTYGIASGTKLGLVRAGSNTKLNSVGTEVHAESGTTYPVQLTNNGEMGVTIPKDTDTHYTAKIATTTSTNNATIKVSEYNDSTEVDETETSITLTGTGGTTVNSDTDGRITISSPSQAPTLVTVSNKTGTVSKTNGILTLNVEGKSYKISYSDDPANKTILTAYTIDNNYAVSFNVGSLSGGIYPATNVSIVTRNPALVKAAASTEASKFLKGDGSWGTPPNTQVAFIDEDGTTAPVTSIVAGENIITTINSGALTISGTANTEYTHETDAGGITSVGITVTPPTDSSTKGIIKLNAATSTSIGGIKANVGGSKTIQHTWTNPGTETVTTNDTQRDVTVYAPVGSNDGTYYPVETTTDDAAVVCIPNVSYPTASTGAIGGFKAASSVSDKTINHITTGNYYSVDIVSSGDNKDQAVVCVPASSGGGSGTTVTYDDKAVTSIAVGSGIEANHDEATGTLTLTRDDIWDTSDSDEKSPTITGTSDSKGAVSVYITKPSSADIMIVEYNKLNDFGTTLFVTGTSPTKLDTLVFTTSTAAYLKITIAGSDKKTYKPFIVKLNWDSDGGIVPYWYN